MRLAIEAMFAMIDSSDFVIKDCLVHGEMGVNFYERGAPSLWTMKANPAAYRAVTRVSFLEEPPILNDFESSSRHVQPQSNW